MNNNRKDILRKIIAGEVPSETDPMGSYTGLPFDEGDVPVQDADDL